MKTFYTFSRTPDGYKYLKRSGELVPNKSGLTLYVYKSDEPFCRRDLSDTRKAWYVVEESTGLSIGTSSTKRGAIDNALFNIEKIGVQKMRESIEIHIQKRGISPLLRATEVF